MSNIGLSSRQVSIPNELSMTNTSTHSLLIDEFLRFVCKIGNKVFKLVLDTVEKVMHAMSWVS
jgi:hypothetical protein